MLVLIYLIHLILFYVSDTSYSAFLFVCLFCFVLFFRFCFCLFLFFCLFVFFVLFCFVCFFDISDESSQ